MYKLSNFSGVVLGWVGNSCGNVGPGPDLVAVRVGHCAIIPARLTCSSHV